MATILVFQSTRPSRASTHERPGDCSNGSISIHKALAGLDTAGPDDAYEYWVFQSTRPSRASTRRKVGKPRRKKFQSTRPSRAST